MEHRSRFKILLTIGVLLLLTPLVLRFFAAPDDTDELDTAQYFPVQDPETGKWGFIDSKGKALTPMVFDWAGDYRQGLGLAESLGAMGYIDETFAETGDWAIAPRFELTHEGDQPAFGFYDGRALARSDDGLWGYIDNAGKWAIAPSYPESRDYPGVPAGEFADGLAWFQVVEMSQRYQLDANDQIERDEENKPIMVPYPRRLVGYIDRKGEVVIEPSYEMAQDFGQGLAAVRIKSHDLWGFIDREGKRVLGPEFNGVGRFSEGLCAVSKDGRWGYIDPQGEVVIDLQFDEVGPFTQGLAAAREGGRWGYINPKGDWVIRPTFDNFEAYAHPGDPRPFENGLARVMLEGEPIYIDTKGNQVWPTAGED